MTLETVEKWAGYKGVTLIGTGDCLYPDHLKSIKKKIEFPPTGIGRLRGGNDKVRWILSTEIALDFDDEGFRRRIHMLMLFRDLETVDACIDSFRSDGQNLGMDGRPKIYLDLNDFIENKIMNYYQKYGNNKVLK